MGSKGSAVTTNTSQQYQANQPILGAIQQSVSGAEQAANAPFQQPVAPVAGFTPFQQQAFGQVAGSQGMAQPYFDAGQAYLQNSAAPVSASDVNQYYNPMASNVTGQLQNIFGQQQRNTTGQLTQAAGGVGADRIAVGQSELANQQGLAAGQTYAGLYQQALQAAQQQKQMQAGAGYGIAQLGPAAQNASLQGSTALGQAGSQQQQLAQAQQTAGYQQQLASIAYPFQTPQYLAGITAGLAPAAGGSTQGQSTTNYPSPSPLAQALGIGTAAVGLGGAFGGFGGSNGLKGSYGGGSGYSLGNAGGTGGGLGGFYASGGSVPYGKIAEKFAAGDPSGNPYAMADGGDPGEGGPFPLSASGLPFPGAGQIPKGVVPTISLPAGGGHSGLMTGNLDLRHQPMPGGQQSGTGQDISAAMKLATAMGGMARGGTAYPRPRALDTGINRPDYFDLSMNNESTVRNIRDAHNPMLGEDRRKQQEEVDEVFRNIKMPRGYAEGGGDDPEDTDAPGGADLEKPTSWGLPGAAYRWATTPGRPYTPPPFPLFGPGKGQDRMAAGNPAGPPGAVAPLDSNPPGGAMDQTGSRGTNLPGMRAHVMTPAEITGEDEEPASRRPGTGGPAYPRGGSQNADMTPDQYFAPKSHQPYPDATQRDWGQNLTRSPWLSLVKAGAAMASSTGPIGSVIGKGLTAGAGELEGQRKELRSEEDHNQKADALWQRAKIELDKYQRKTPHELAVEAHQQQALSQGKYQFINYSEPGSTEIKVGRANPKTGEFVDAATGQAANIGRIHGRSSNPADKGVVTPAQAGAAQNYVLNAFPKLKPGTPEFNTAVDQALAERKRAAAAAAGQPGAQAPAANAPQIGEKKQFKQGVGVWNGTSWVPEGQ